MTTLLTLPELEQIVLAVVAHDPDLARLVAADSLSPEGREVMAYLVATGGNLDPSELDGEARSLARSLMDGARVAELVSQVNAKHWIRRLPRERAKAEAIRRARL